MSTAIFFNPGDTRLLGKNQDIPYNEAYLFTNHRNIAKSALIQSPEQPARWVSRYGSLTVSQVGKEMPHGGINEVGLAVEQTSLWQSSYPDISGLPAIGELQWIQRILDTCATVKEAEEAAHTVRIAQPMSRLHYLIADRSGDCAVIEFFGGGMHVYHGASLPYPLLANTPYTEAVRDWHDKDEAWRNGYSDYNLNSMERFSKGVKGLEEVSTVSERVRLSFAQESLRMVRREDTAYSIIYDLENMQLHFYTNSYPELKAVQMDKVDLASDAAPKAMNLQQPAAIYLDYNTNVNRRVAESFFKDPLLKDAFDWHISDEMIHFFAAFPEQFPKIS